MVGQDHDREEPVMGDSTEGSDNRRAECAAWIGLSPWRRRRPWRYVQCIKLFSIFLLDPAEEVHQLDPK